MFVYLTIFWLTSIFIGLDADKKMGPVGNIVVNSIYLCKDTPQGKEVVLNIDLKNIDGKGNKAMFANLTTTIDFDQNIEYTLDIYKWESGNWKQNFDNRGKICPDLQKFGPKIWQKLRSGMVPPITLPCPVKAGTYTADKFQASSKDITIPSIFYGRFKVKVVWIKAGKKLVCIQGEGDSQAP